MGERLLTEGRLGPPVWRDRHQPALTNCITLCATPPSPPSHHHSASPLLIHTQREFKVIKQEEILQEQDKLISDVSTLLDVPHSCAGIMLRHFRWDSEKLNEKYWEDPTKVQVAAGVQHMGTLAEKIDPETVRRRRRRRIGEEEGRGLGVQEEGRRQ